MKKAIFVTGTGTDVGKTYVTALLINKMKEFGFSVGYYKAALSGAISVDECDASFVKKITNLDDDVKDIVSYIYKNPFSPHLCSKIEGNKLEMDKVKSDFNRISEKYDFVIVEGSGGVVCPIRYDDKKIMLLDIVKKLNLDTIVVSGCNLGSINSCVLTISYLKSNNINIKGIVINNYEKSILNDDNIFMIEELTKVKVLSVIEKDSKIFNLEKDDIDMIFV